MKKMVKIKAVRQPLFPFAVDFWQEQCTTAVYLSNYMNAASAACVYACDST